MKYRTLKRIIIILRACFWLLLASCLFHFTRRIFVAERFIVPSDSMSPTITTGQKIWVNKILFGARIYKSFNFEDHAPLKCFRVPGIRKIQYGDVICFNYPHGYDDMSKIEFRINYVYCKRVLGTPGDRIGAVDGHYWNDRILSPVGVVREQESLRWMFDSVFIWSKCYDVLSEADMGWNIKNWGPLTVPAKDMTIKIDDVNRELYRTVIEYETGNEIDGSLSEYTFMNNYYFGVGDNAISSQDSRYWGFIPEDFIIGIVGGKKVKNNPFQTYLANEK